MNRTFFDINFINFFSDLSPKAKSMKAKVNTWDIITLRSFFIRKEVVDKVPILCRMGENICK